MQHLQHQHGQGERRSDKRWMPRINHFFHPNSRMTTPMQATDVRARQNSSQESRCAIGCGIFCARAASFQQVTAT